MAHPTHSDKIILMICVTFNRNYPDITADIKDIDIPGSKIRMCMKVVSGAILQASHSFPTVTSGL